MKKLHLLRNAADPDHIAVFTPSMDLNPAYLIFGHRGQASKFVEHIAHNPKYRKHAWKVVETSASDLYDECDEIEDFRICVHLGGNNGKSS